MGKTKRVTILVDNTATVTGLMGEHGLSLWIETDGSQVLFDTGAGKALPHNAGPLGIQLGQTDAMILSHGHYDHTGGLGHALAKAGERSIYVHPAAFEPKYAVMGESASHGIGMPITDQEIRELTGRIVLTESLTEVCDGLYVTGEIPRDTGFEDTG